MDAFAGQFEQVFKEAIFGLLVMSLTIWAVALIQFNFVDDWMTAIMLTASFFTSVGNFTVNLPVDWRLIPSAIAFTGMFSFAWATASTLSMLRDFSDALEKNKEL